RADQLASHLVSENPTLRAEALRLATTRPEWGGSLVGYLKSALDAEPVSPALTEAFVRFSSNGEVQALIAEALRRKSTRQLALEVMGRAELKAAPESWRAALQSELQRSPDAGVIGTIGQLQAEGRLEVTAFTVDWQLFANDKSLDTSARLAALDVGGRPGEFSITDELFGLLVAQFDPGVAIMHRVKAAEILGRATLAPSQRRTCISLVSKAGPLELGSVLAVFRSGADAETLDLLVAALSGSPGFFSLSAGQLEAVFRGYAGARTLLEKIRRASSERAQRVDNLVASVAARPGDAERGKAAFAKGTCIVCHKTSGEGGLLGPDLTTIGAVRNERDLLEAIAFPAATFARGYEPFLITMKDGSERF
ncbi:MAG: c-type cytochrome, partial [Akkermansiaceae bacterium]|nr:c-type cytochrome [Akkermansiaceae bacterium]